MSEQIADMPSKRIRQHSIDEVIEISGDNEVIIEISEDNDSGKVIRKQNMNNAEIQLNKKVAKVKLNYKEQEADIPK
eukprot:13554469-Heterocapsa_arctica.AAC.1